MIVLKCLIGIQYPLLENKNLFSVFSPISGYRQSQQLVQVTLCHLLKTYFLLHEFTIV